ncbi:uncharacterized protein LOC122702227 [Cervus elaphus]|uniref:uncharacterized protein LOC122702227 n=1 Tax=Cervus elaphus TaxID=9860 RepID=UPI001CC29731|nr:uncharacterized protein LOC122702227 [Cervus elaphus]
MGTKDIVHPSQVQRRAPSLGPRLPLLDAVYADCSAELDTRVTRNLEFNLPGKGLSCETGKDQANGSLRKEQTRERVLDCGRNRRDGSEVCSARCWASPGRICSGLGFQRTRAVRSGERSPRTAGPWLLGRWDRRAGSGGLPLTARMRTGNSRQTPLSEVLIGRGLLERRLTASLAKELKRNKFPALLLVLTCGVYREDSTERLREGRPGSRLRAPLLLRDPRRCRSSTARSGSPVPPWKTASGSKRGGGGARRTPFCVTQSSCSRAAASSVKAWPERRWHCHLSGSGVPLAWLLNLLLSYGR